MTCQSCVSAVKSALKPIEGIESYDIDLENKQVVVTGRAAPSVLCRALKDTGRQVLVRGSGTASGESSNPFVPHCPLDVLMFCPAGTHEGAAVAILETPLPNIATASATAQQLEESQQVHGIARMVQVSTSPVLLLMDLTVSFPEFKPASPSPISPAPSYDVYVARTGDVTSPPSTTGPVHLPLATITPDPRTGYADAFVELPIGLWDIVGRAMVVEPTEEVRRRQRLAEAQDRVQKAEQEVKGVIGSKGRLGILAGVIARSAGAWGNEVSKNLLRF
jgi:copper chaperone CopZ